MRSSPKFGIYPLLAVLIWAFSAVGEEIRVVARQDSPIAGLTTAETADLFLGRGVFPVSLKPVDRSDEALRERFYRAVADMSLKSVRAHWAELVFTGRGHPPELLSAEAAEQRLLRDPAVVTFVSGGWLPRDSKVLLVIETEAAP
jgi:hypothetical protein